jgi:hypothetical protein
MSGSESDVEGGYVFEEGDVRKKSKKATERKMQTTLQKYPLMNTFDRVLAPGFEL